METFANQQFDVSFPLLFKLNTNRNKLGKLYRFKGSFLRTSTYFVILESLTKHKNMKDYEYAITFT